MFLNMLIGDILATWQHILIYASINRYLIRERGEEGVGKRSVRFKQHPRALTYLFFSCNLNIRYIAIKQEYIK